MSASLLFIAMLGVGHGTNEEQNMLLAASVQARTMARAFQGDDYAKLAELTYASKSAKPLTRSQLVHAWKKKATSFRNQGLRLQSFQVEAAKSLVKIGAECLCVIPTTLKFQAVEGSASLKSYLLAFSHDQGKTWQFVDAADRDTYAKAWLAKVPEGFSLPVVSSVRVENESTHDSIALQASMLDP